VDSIGHDHLPDTFNGKAVLESLSVDPQQFAERVGVAAVGLDFRLFLGLDEDDLFDAVVGQRFEQPIVETADFDNGDHAASSGLLLELGEEVFEAFRLGADLSIEDDLAEVISQRDSELLCVLVDSEVQHGFGSPGGTK